MSESHFEEITRFSRVNGKIVKRKVMKEVDKPVETKYKKGDTVRFKRGDLTGIGKVKKVEVKTLICKDCIILNYTQYILDFCPHGEIFEEHELMPV